MIYVTCYFLIIGTDIKINHTNKINPGYFSLATARKPQ